MELIVKELERVALFQGLSPFQLSEIARRAERVIYNPGAVIIEENEEGDAAVLLVSGETVRVSGPELQSRAEPVATGSLLGEMAMLVETTHSSTVVSRSKVRALRLMRDELHAQMKDDPQLAERISHNLTGRLSSMAEELRRVDAILASRPGRNVLHGDQHSTPAAEMATQS